MNFTAIVNSLPPEVWFVLLGSVVATVTQFAKKWLSLQSPKVVMALTTALSVVATVVPSLLAAINHNPAVLGQHAVAVLGAATLLYRYVIQPADAFLQNYRQYKAAQSAQVTSPVVPATPTAAPATEAPAPVLNEFIG
jgi:peptidoglycan/LPS O-acetylase OafA/YrhL